MVTDLQVSPKRSPLSLGYTNTYGPRDSCAPSGQRNYQPDAVRYDAKGVGTQFMIVSGVGGGCGKGRCPETFSHLVILELDLSSQEQRSTNYSWVAEVNI